jgi:hypothetical protein
MGDAAFFIIEKSNNGFGKAFLVVQNMEEYIF